MGHRLRILAVILVPLALVAGAYLIGVDAPGQALGRNYVVRIALPEAGRPVGLPPVEGPDDPGRPLVVIDAGHGGHDPGAVGGGFDEKTLTLGLAEALRDELLRAGGIRVAMTRSDDSFLVLEERAEIARQLGADLFLSIHADSAGEQDEITGASVYTLSDRASSEAAERFAARENNADVVNGVALSGRSDAVNSILVDLAQRRTSESSARLAELILREGGGTLRFHPQARRSAALAVLRAPDVPSVLYEGGFVTNPDDAARLASPEGRGRFAEVMARAIRIYFAREGSI
jgi:N-acetylmuramoyl-L-alanine amidase